MSFFRDALAGGLMIVRQATGVPILYRRGDDIVEITATVGQTSLKVMAAENVEVRKKWRDYLIDVPNLVLAGSPTRPEIGDLITDGEEEFRVASPVAGEPPFEVEAQGLCYRVHARRVSGGPT